ncbi:hypothetical protein MNL76_07615 [Fervidobacterium riparium]|nr:hypothetical protein IB67_01675 [Fervidobacterium riparium]
MNKRKLINYALWIFIALFVIYEIYSEVGYKNNFGVMFTNLIITIISVFFLVFGDRYNFSLNKIFYTFSLIFFGIAPAFQYKYNVVFWNMGDFNDEDYFRTNLLIIFILISYQTFYYLFSKLKYKPRATNRKLYNPRSKTVTIFLFSLITTFFVMYYFNFNINSLLFRAFVTHKFEERSLMLIFSNFIRPIPVILFIYYKTMEQNNKFIESLLLLLVLISNFPTSEARYYTGTLYIAILLVYIRSFFKKYMLFNNLLILAFLIFFPFLNNFRSNVTWNLNLNLKYSFLAGDFDSFQMFMKVVKENYITYGKQLLTVLLFFVPRSLWTNKSVGSGSLLANTYKFTWSNISMNFFGEGYINFGIFGVFLFVIILSFTNAIYDKFFWHSKENLSDWRKVYYLFFIGLEIFILRGDLLSSFAYSMGILASVYFTWKIIYENNFRLKI